MVQVIKKNVKNLKGLQLKGIKKDAPLVNQIVRVVVNDEKKRKQQRRKKKTATKTSIAENQQLKTALINTLNTNEALAKSSGHSGNNLYTSLLNQRDADHKKALEEQKRINNDLINQHQVLKNQINSTTDTISNLIKFGLGNNKLSDFAESKSKAKEEEQALPDFNSIVNKAKLNQQIKDINTEPVKTEPVKTEIGELDDSFDEELRKLRENMADLTPIKDTQKPLDEQMENYQQNIDQEWQTQGGGASSPQLFWGFNSDLSKYQIERITFKVFGNTHEGNRNRIIEELRPYDDISDSKLVDEYTKLYNKEPRKGTTRATLLGDIFKKSRKPDRNVTSKRGSGRGTTDPNEVD